MSEFVLRNIEDGVGVVSLNRPERHNAINDEMAPALADAIEWAIRSAEVRCVLLRGEGPSFCSGRDTSELGDRPGGESDFVYVRRSQDARLAMLDAPKPIVAAVRGHVVGGGMEMALAADMRIAATDVRMRLPQVRYGIVTGTGGSQVLTSLIGPSKTKYLLMTGDAVDGQRALEWGIVDWLVAPDELDAEAMALAKRLAAGPPMAIAMIKQLVDQLHGESIRRGTRAELLAQSALFRSDDRREAKAAAAEGRPATFRGS